MSERRREMAVLLGLVREVEEDGGDDSGLEGPAQGVGEGSGPPLRRLLDAPWVLFESGGGPGEPIQGFLKGRYPFLEGRSVREVLLDPATRASDLRSLAELGEGLLDAGVPPHLRVLGRALGFFCSASSLVHHGCDHQGISAEELRRGGAYLERFGVFDKDLQDLCLRAGEFLLRGGRGP